MQKMLTKNLVMIKSLLKSSGNLLAMFLLETGSETDRVEQNDIC